MNRRALLAAGAAAALAPGRALARPVVDGGSPVPPPVAPVPPCGNWDRLGAFVADASAAGPPPRELAWAAVEDTPHNWDEVRRGWGRGLAVVPWVLLGTDPVADAARLRELGGSVAVCDLELPTEALPGYSREYLRALGPGWDLLLSGIGAAYGDWVRSVDYAAWRDYGAAFAPQCYPNEFGPVYAVARCVAHARRAGWPLARVKPTVGCYAASRPYSAAGYAADLRAAGTRGVSLYKLETAAPGDVAVLASAGATC